MSEELLSLLDIKKKLGKKQVLDSLSFKVFEKEIFGLIGKSGCGKSTLLKIIVGMIKPDGGKISFDKKNSLSNLNYLRKHTGFATQENMLFDELSIKENSFYFGQLYNMKGRDIKSNFQELINLLGLGGFENTLVKHLSGGMVKRANLLVSLIHSPKLLILDEPTTGLDPLLRKILWDYIHKINSSGTTILVTSHLIEEIEKNCNRIAIMDNGKIIALASAGYFKKRYGEGLSMDDIFQIILK